LETSPRGIYTGAIGYLAPGRRACFNVAIRTVSIARAAQRAEYGVGGGVVWDSTAQGEYDEALLKAQAVKNPPRQFDLLETMRWSAAEGYFLLDLHLQRLQDSATYFDFVLNVDKLRSKLQAEVCQFNGEAHKVRVLLGRAGGLRLEYSPLNAHAAAGSLRIRLAEQGMDSHNVFLFHKTNRREMYPTIPPGVDELLLFNERGELTEFVNGNFVAEMDGALWTPPLMCGLLPGTMRAHALVQGKVTEKVLARADLDRCTRLFFINSVRGWREVVME
jgi:para-aminobenzoate synthetase / 4-amino-4-deoxychorismate lyase